MSCELSKNSYRASSQLQHSRQASTQGGAGKHPNRSLNKSLDVKLDYQTLPNVHGGYHATSTNRRIKDIAVATTIDNYTSR